MDVASNLLKEENTLSWQPIAEEVSNVLCFDKDNMLFKNIVNQWF